MSGNNPWSKLQDNRPTRENFPCGKFSKAWLNNGEGIILDRNCKTTIPLARIKKRHAEYPACRIRYIGYYTSNSKMALSSKVVTYFALISALSLEYCAFFSALSACTCQAISPSPSKNITW